MSLMSIRRKNIQPFLYKKALEQMVSEWKELDEIYNTEFYAAMEADEESSSDNNKEESSSSNDKEKEKEESSSNSESEKSEEEGEKKSMLSNAREKIRAIIDKIIEAVTGCKDELSKKVSKSQEAKDEFLEKYDAAKKAKSMKTGINVENFTYANIGLVQAVSERISHDFNNADAAVAKLFNMFGMEDAGKITADQISLKDSNVFDGEGNFKQDYFKNVAGQITELGQINDSDPEAFVQNFEAKVRGDKKTYTINARDVNIADAYLRNGYNNHMTALTNNLARASSAMKNLDSKQRSPVFQNTNKEAGDRLAKYLKSYGQYVSFCNLFFKSVFDITGEYKTNCQIVLMRAYDFTDES